MKYIKDSWPLFGILYFSFTLIFTFLYTYPLIFNLNNMFYGFPWDSLYDIAHLWWLKFSYLNGFPQRINSYIAYPFGHDNSYAPFQYFHIVIGFVFTLFSNEVVAYNIIKLISFPLLALTTYLLIHYLLNDKLVAAFGGLVYAFAPFHVIHSMAHVPYLYWVPLTILFLMRFLKKGGCGNAVLLGLLWGITFVTNPYNAYFIGLIVPIFVIWSVLNKGKSADMLKILKYSPVLFFVFFLTIFPMLYPMIKGQFAVENKLIVESGIIRPISDLFIFSAKPLDYLLPSKHNLFFGWLIPDLGMGSLKGHRYADHTLYLGYSLIFLGGYAFYCAVRKKGYLGENREERHMVYLFFAVAIVAAILSAPPFIPLGSYHINPQTREVMAEYKLYLPQYFLYKLFPMFRVYARMGAVVSLAVCVLSASGLKEILITLKTGRGRYLFLSLSLFVVFIEYAEFPPFRFTKVQEPEAYKWLAVQPERFSIVEYPLGNKLKYPYGIGGDPYTTYEYAYYQRLHKKYLVNGAIEGTPADEFREKIIDISRIDTINELSKIGVKFILIHKDKYVKGNETVPLDWLTKPPRDKIFPVEYNDGKVPEIPMEKIRLVKDFGDTVVYEVIP